MPVVAGDRRGGLLALALACALWSTTYVIVKPVLEHVPPFTLAVLRFGVAALLLVPLGLREPGRLPSWPVLVALGFFGITAFFATFNYGLMLTTASEAAMIQGGGPA